MNKYTAKTTDFLFNNFSSYLNNYDILPNHPLTLQIQNLYKECDNDDKLELQISSKYLKLHNVDEDCLIYIIFNELYNDGIIKEITKNDLLNINNFNMWYRSNHTKFNLSQILLTLKSEKKYKQFYEVFYFPTKNRKDLHQLLYKNSFISLDNIQHAESSDILYKKYKNKHIDLSLYLPIEKNSENKYDEPNVDLINKIFLFMSKLFKASNEKLKLVVFYGNQKKMLDFSNKNNFLCSDNVNSGVSIKHELIMIWRKEEFYKVLIHELVHFFGIDFYVNDSIYEKLNELLNLKYKIVGSDKINESYTEAIAIFLHSIIYSEENMLNINDVMKYEIMFSHFQMAKILSYFNCESFDKLEKTNIKQNTSVFSYYIIKSILMVNYLQLFDFWLENGFKILNGNENKYEILYTKIIKKNNIDENTLNFFINYVTNNVTEFGESFIFKTMRMSCYSF